MIHVIGDSHCCIFSGQEAFRLWNDEDRLKNDILPEFRTYRIGPATAFQLDRKLVLLETILSQFVKPGDIVMPCCGEVDCRAHLLKQAAVQRLPIDQIVQICVDKYYNTLLQLKTWAEYNRCKLAVWGPIASKPDSIEYDGPFQGTCADRNNATRLFTNKLREACVGAGITFGSVFEKMVDENSNTKVQYISSYIHSSLLTIPLIYDEAKAIGLLKG